MAAPPIPDSEFEAALESWDHKVDGSWELAKELDGGILRLYRRPWGDSGLYEFFFRGYFSNVTAAALWAIVKDIEYRQEWDPYTMHVSWLPPHSSGAEAVYWQVKFPWPLHPRDYVYHRRSRIFAETNTYCIISSGTQEPLKPHDSSFVRVTSLKTALTTRDIDGNCHFRFFYRDDPGGSIPHSVVNWFLHKAVPKRTQGLVDACLSYDLERLKLMVAKSEVIGHASSELKVTHDGQIAAKKPKKKKKNKKKKKHGQDGDIQQQESAEQHALAT